MVITTAMVKAMERRMVVRRGLMVALFLACLVALGASSR
jgi:hypothetical protein